MDTNLDFLDRVSVLVVGDVMLDRYIWGAVKRISPEAPVPVVEIDRETHTAGGAANVALNLRVLGVRCELFGIVGNDANGRELQALLQKQSVSFDPALALSRIPTITKTRIVAHRQQLCRLDQEADLPTYSVAEAGLLGLLAEKAESYDAVILSDYAKGVISQPVIDTLRRVRTKKPVFLALDPKPSRTLDIGGMDLLTPNRGEAIQLAGLPAQGRDGPPIEKVVEAIREKHRPECLVVTLSEDGMLLRKGSAPSRHFPTAVRQVADVSGAGDTVIATLTAALAAGVPADRSLAIANAAAGIVVGKLGTATVTRAELAEALAGTPETGTASTLK
ncbi:MAG TPA: PfkB family carbohydrate kinase [Candidatus Didemnitutus sp.]|nr:PfkB family carbohydrate kinase [Candidatus Didemnitutus sp.]